MNLSPFIVLLVEDDANDALLLRRAFHRAKLTSLLHVVSDAEEAMAYLEQTPPFNESDEYPAPSLLLLDLNLPRTSGLDLLRWLRKKPAPLKELPVIILTSSRDTEDIDQAYALGANSYMAKPNGNFDGLAEMVKEFDQSGVEKKRP
ncbi:MAG: response regulator [Verrucomicrobiota bacterium]